MSDVMKAIRVVSFNDKKENYRMWSKKFLSIANARKYKEILMGSMVAPKANEIIDETTDAGALKAEARELNEKAYNDLVLACTGEIGFSIVDEAVTNDLPEGDARLAWTNLEKKFQPSSSANKVQLRREFNSSKLNSWKKDPDSWISKLEIKRKRLKKMGNDISDEDFIIHVLNNLPLEYDNVVEALERKLDDLVNPLTIIELRDELTLKFARIKKNKGISESVENDSDDEAEEEAALFSFQKNFKGRCHHWVK